MRQLTLLLGLFLSILGASASAEVAPSGATIAAAEKSVVQVWNRCANVTGSGFFWRDAHTIVTALHVAGNCKDLQVWLHGKWWPANVARVAPDRDLALLSVTSTSGTPLAFSSTAPATGERVVVLGYPVGVPSRTSATLEVIYGDNSTLSALLPSSALKKLLATSSLKPTTNIVRLGGHLVPGYSGAPIINKGGLVVAVGSGGLQGGLAGIGWGIRANYLPDLATSGAPYLSNSTANGLLFAMTKEGASQSIQCGDARFNFVEDRTISEVLETSDDKGSFVTLASNSGMDLEVLGSREVRIFADPVSGASFAVPKETKFERHGGECIAKIGANLTLRLLSKRVKSLPDFNEQFVRFETGFERSDLLWSINPNWSYPVALVRPDGLVVVRKMLNGVSGNALRGWAAETILERDNFMFGVQLINYKLDGESWANCKLKPADDASCIEVRAGLFAYSEALLGTFLATAPVR